MCLSGATGSSSLAPSRRNYQAAGVGEYWVVDPDARIVERWTPDDHRPEIVDDVLIRRQEGKVLVERPLAALFGRENSADAVPQRDPS